MLDGSLTVPTEVRSPDVVCMSDPGLAPRDAFHAAHAVDSHCPVIVSSDPYYGRLDTISRRWCFPVTRRPTADLGFLKPE